MEVIKFHKQTLQILGKVQIIKDMEESRAQVYSQFICYHGWSMHITKINRHHYGFSNDSTEYVTSWRKAYFQNIKTKKSLPIAT